MPYVYFVPSGLKNLSLLIPNVPWNDIEEYYLEFSQGATTIATTNKFQVCKCINEESVKLHFLNYLGTFDVINFSKPVVIHEDSSEEFKKGLGYPLDKLDSGTMRFNVNSNDTYQVTYKAKESEMPWLQECKDSPLSFIELKAVDSQPDSYLPVVILSGKFEKLKNNKEYQYDFNIEFRLGNEFTSIRN